MRKINFQQVFWTVLIAVLLTSTLISCDSIAKKRACRHWSREVIHTFPNTNWAFEEEVLDFSFDIEDTTQYYDVAVKLTYDTAVAELKDIPLSLTLSTPDGMKSFSKSHFLLDQSQNPDIQVAKSGNTAELSVVVYPRRKFKVPGTYTLTVYRRAEKADNYGFITLSTKVNVVK